MLFLDTEYTDLVKSPLLLSVGVTGGSTEFYAEVTDRARLSKCSTFVLDTVLPQFGLIPGAACSFVELGARFAHYLERELGQLAPGEVLDIAYDFEMDWKLVLQALQSQAPDVWGKIESRVRPVDISDLANSSSAMDFVDQYFDEQLVSLIGRHHALCDARALAGVYGNLSRR